MKTGSDRKYTAEFRDSAVKQVVEGGRTMPVLRKNLVRRLNGRWLARTEQRGTMRPW